MEEVPSFCVPSDGVFCQRCSWQHDACAAGPERSGSTWLFNAVRLLLKSAQIPYDPYWITNLSQLKLQQRKDYAQTRWVVIKTHYWSDEWESEQADHVLLTHRELSEVIASYKRVGWAFNIPDSYVREHQQWQAIADRDFGYEKIMQEPEQQLQDLAQCLGIADKVDLQAVNQELQSLKPANRGAPDPVSKLWPNHYSPQVQKHHELGLQQIDTQETAKQNCSTQTQRSKLRQRFPDYYAHYGYE